MAKIPKRKRQSMKLYTLSLPKKPYDIRNPSLPPSTPSKTHTLPRIPAPTKKHTSATSPPKKKQKPSPRHVEFGGSGLGSRGARFGGSDAAGRIGPSPGAPRRDASRGGLLFAAHVSAAHVGTAHVGTGGQPGGKACGTAAWMWFLCNKTHPKQMERGWEEELSYSQSNKQYLHNKHYLVYGTVEWFVIVKICWGTVISLLRFITARGTYELNSFTFWSLVVFLNMTLFNWLRRSIFSTSKSMLISRFLLNCRSVFVLTHLTSSSFSLMFRPNSKETLVLTSSKPFSFPSPSQPFEVGWCDSGTGGGSRGNHRQRTRRDGQTVEIAGEKSSWNSQLTFHLHVDIRISEDSSNHITF